MDFETIKREGIYDYVANHYFELSKEQIKNITIEIIWALVETKGDYEKACKMAIRTLKDIYEED